MSSLMTPMDVMPAGRQAPCRRPLPREQVGGLRGVSLGGCSGGCLRARHHPRTGSCRENLAVVSARHRTSCSLCRAVRVACREGRTRIQAARSGRAAPFASRFAPCPLGRTGPGRAERAGRGEVVAGRRRLRPRPVVAGGAGGGGSSSLARASIRASSQPVRVARTVGPSWRRQQARFRSGAVVGHQDSGKQSIWIDGHSRQKIQISWMLDAQRRSARTRNPPRASGRADDGACARDSQRMDTIGSPRAGAGRCRRNRRQRPCGK